MKNFPIWAAANAWREIFSRIFANINTKYNVSPEWLVNPATNRRLKLDMQYPDLGVAVRIEGLGGKQRRQRASLEEEEQEQTRLHARQEMCRAHNVELIVVSLADEPQAIFKTIDIALGRAGQRSKKPDTLQTISQARAKATQLSRRITAEKDLQVYADLWGDRQYQVPEPAATPAVAQIPSFEEGMEVEHAAFGPGVILAVTPDKNDILLSVDFITAGQKTLSASLVADKLTVRS